ncbi:MAG: hypothetical protein ACRD2E_13010 [Terriglobales bacterium]
MDWIEKVRGSLRGGPSAAVAPTVGAKPALRHSNGLRELTRAWQREPGLAILDLGPTSSANIGFISNLGHKVLHEDLLMASADPRFQHLTETGPGLDPVAFLAANLHYPAASLDGALLWDVLDYVPEAALQPLVTQLAQTIKPGGMALGYFHARADPGPSPCVRYHIHDDEHLELRPGAAMPLARALNNRAIERLFSGFRAIKFFLARDHLREVLVTK